MLLTLNLVILLLFNLYNEGSHELLFVRHVENNFDSIGLSFIFSNQMPVNVNWIKVNIKQIYCTTDQFQLVISCY
jgi:hypothetical protein